MKSSFSINNVFSILILIILTISLNSYSISFSRKESKTFSGYSVDSVSKFDLSSTDKLVDYLKTNDLKKAFPLLQDNSLISIDSLQNISKGISRLISNPKCIGGIKKPTIVLIKNDTLMVSYTIRIDSLFKSYYLYFLSMKIIKPTFRIISVDLSGGTEYSEGKIEFTKERRLLLAEDIGNNEILLTITSNGNSYGTIISYSDIKAVTMANGVFEITCKTNFSYRLTNPTGKVSKDLSTIIEHFNKILIGVPKQ